MPLAHVRNWMALLLLWNGGVKNETPANTTRRDVDLRQSLPSLGAHDPAIHPSVTALDRERSGAGRSFV